MKALIRKDFSSALSSLRSPSPAPFQTPRPDTSGNKHSDLASRRFRGFSACGRELPSKLPSTQRAAFGLPAGGLATAGLVVDLFAGGGGASVGIEAALGRPVDLAVDHSATALAVHAANHPRTVHLTADIYEVDPLQATGGRPVDLLWASPDCTHFSIAKGNVPRSQKIRTLAWTVVKWARAVAPRVICLENVQEFRGWGPLSKDGRPDKARMGETFTKWKRALEKLGYVVDHRILDASLYGAPTRRRRLFLVARRDGLPITWPKATHGQGLLQIRTAAECIDWSLPCPSIFERSRPLAEKTLWRIAQGIRRFVLENPRPFLTAALVEPGQRHGRGDASVESPLSTVMAKDRHALAAVALAKFRGTHESQPASLPVTEPLPTTSAGGIHAEVRAFLTAYYGEDATSGQSLFDPARTITAKHRLGLVTVEGTEYQIVDIGMRMLEPHELLRAQFGRFAESYDLSQAKTKSAKVRLIGNSVCPEVAEALVRANVPSALEMEGAA